MSIRRTLSLVCAVLFLSVFYSCSAKDDSEEVTDKTQETDNNNDLSDDLSDEALAESEDTESEDAESEDPEPDKTPDETPDETPDDTVPSGEGAYRQCDPAMAGSCPEGMNCVKGYDNAKYGQCLKPCSENTDCPPPPETTQQVACHNTEKVCLILCGSYEGECPEWLECFGQEMCLPPSGITPTKGPGEKCNGKDECIGDSDCIEGSSGIAYCYPLCDPNVADDCANKAPGFQAQCTNAGSFSFCMFSCQGVPCPGELQCVAGVFCQG
ncbi:MAG TPA: hypothetical protein PLX56_07155 [bacterium]|jgi:hypothetical protein|nr:hypothetical protein [bacterium]MDX9806502.1 hypothetical protein [bacterium]HOG43061.1 hypothetical protein [bacterium]HQB10956.1 hypothetical protein [bacterium]HQN73065.1 hypothetical protein [bacterium]